VKVVAFIIMSLAFFVTQVYTPVQSKSCKTAYSYWAVWSLSRTHYIL